MGQVLSVFCETPLLNRWLELERESCTTGVENVLMSDARWKNRYSEVADLDLVRSLHLFLLSVICPWWRGTERHSAAGV